jgi:16S rRNA G1207 methylase RsmC
MLVDVKIYDNKMLSEMMSSVIAENLGENVLELGCGNGAISINTIKNDKNVKRITLSDINPVAISFAKANVNNYILQEN